VLRGDAALDDAGGKEEAIGYFGALILVEGSRQFVRFEGNSFGFAASSAENAVVTITFAGGRHHGFYDLVLACWRRNHADAGWDIRRATWRSFGLRVITGRFVFG